MLPGPEAGPEAEGDWERNEHSEESGDDEDELLKEDLLSDSDDDDAAGDEDDKDKPLSGTVVDVAVVLQLGRGVEDESRVRHTLFLSLPSSSSSSSSSSS